MDAQIIDLQRWNAALAMGLAWQKLWLKVLFPQRF
jgi:ABC-type amino acid transport system permease subunit